MTVFSEKVIPTFTSSDHNIIVVESFNEIFFDVFELEINGNKYVAEKVSEKDGKPVVSIPLTHNGQKKNVPFLLEKGDETAVYYNESNTRLIRPVRETKIEKIDILNLVESKIQERVPLFEIPDVERAVDNIKAVKESAVEYLNKCRSEYVEAQKREIDSFESKKKQEIKKLNEEYRKNMVSEFLSLTENVKNQILESNSEERSDYNGYIRELFVEYCQEIEGRVDNNYETAINSLESKVNTLTETVFADKIQNIFENRVNEVEKIISANDTLTNKKLDKELSRISTRIDSKIDVSSRENIKSIESLAERYDNALRTLEESVIDTNNNFIKSSNKALSRIGNVKNELSEKIDKVNLDINTLSEIQVGLRENIETHRGNIKKYFNKKISFLDTKITDVNEGYKKDIIDLIRESERKLLEEIAGIDTKLPTLILKEARTKKDNVEVSLEDIRKELENNISGRFSKEIVSLKRLIEMTSGGGGAGGGTSGGSQTLLFDENTAILYISNGNFVSLSALSGGGGGGGGITVETDPKFTTWAQANSAKYESTYTSFNTNSAKYDSVYTSFNTNSAKYDSVYTTVGAESAGWGLLSALNDVNIPSPVNGQVLQYSSATNKWIAGSPASATGATGYYGSFFDTTAGVLTAANQAKKVAIAQTFESNGITVSDSKIVFSHAGTYELIYSIQYKSTDNFPQDIYVWLRKNGIDVPDSSSIFLINAKKDTNSPSQLVAVTPFVATLTAGEYIELYWHCAATTVSIETFVINHNDPVIPRTPGTIVTVKQITNLLLPTVGTYLPLSGGSLTGPVSSNQDIEITDSTKGIILRSPSSIKYRVTVSDLGELITTQI